MSRKEAISENYNGRPIAQEKQNGSMSDSGIWFCNEEYCCCCCSFLGFSHSILTRFKYLFILLIATVLCFFTVLLHNLRLKVKEIQGFCISIVSPNMCDRLFGYFSVYRVCFSVCILHFAMSLFLIGVKSNNEPRTMFHNGFWPLKCIALLGMVTGTYFIPNWSYFYKVFMEIGMAGSFVIALIQVLLIIDFAQYLHQLGTSTDETERENHQWKCKSLVLFSTASVMHVLSIVGVALLYLSFGNRSSCKTKKYFIIFNVCQCILAFSLSMLPVVQKVQGNTGFLKSSLMTLFTIFSTWIALSNGPHTTCNIAKHPSFSELNEQKNLSIQAISSSFLTLLLLIYEIISSALSRSKSILWPLASIDQANTQTIAKSSLKDTESDDVTVYSFSIFHFVMFLSSIHIMMSLTNWYVPQTDSKNFEASWTAVWVKMGSSSACVWIYIWTLMSPVLRSAFYSSSDDIVNFSSRNDKDERKKSESSAENREKMTAPNGLPTSNYVKNLEKSDSEIRNFEIHRNSNFESVNVSHGSMSRKPSLRTTSPKSDAEKEMLRLQNKVISLQGKIAKLQTKVATLQGLNI